MAKVDEIKYLTDEQLAKKYAVVHKHDDVYEVNGDEIEGLPKAQAFSAQMILAHKTIAAPDLTSKLPSGFKVRDPADQLLWRGSVMEVAMNETHMPNRVDLNRYYDREWYYAWGSATNKLDVAEKRAKGYQAFSEEDLIKGIEEGRIPDIYRTILRPEGSFLLYGDAVLLRVPRVYREQMAAEEAEAAVAAIKAIDRKQRDGMDNLLNNPNNRGVTAVDMGKGANEVIIRT